MDIDKFLKDKGLKVDCIVESDIDVAEYVQYDVRDLIKEAIKEQLRLYIVSEQRKLLRDFSKYCEKYHQYGCYDDTVDRYIASIS